MARQLGKVIAKPQSPKLFTAGVAYWVAGYALPALGQMPLRLFPMGLVEIVVASVAGAWLYKEQTQQL